MGFIASLFSGPKTPKAPKPPSTDSSAVQQAAEDARRRMAMARGRSSTIVGGRQTLGSVGSA